jgi:hypothetical protein
LACTKSVAKVPIRATLNSTDWAFSWRLDNYRRRLNRFSDKDFTATFSTMGIMDTTSVAAAINFSTAGESDNTPGINSTANCACKGRVLSQLSWCDWAVACWYWWVTSVVCDKFPVATVLQVICGLTALTSSITVTKLASWATLDWSCFTRRCYKTFDKLIKFCIYLRNGCVEIIKSRIEVAKNIV